MLVEGKTDEAVKELGDCLRIWQQIHEAIAKSIELLGVDPDKLMVRDETLMDAIGRPKNVLLQIRDALRKPVDRFDAAAMQALLDCPWPGNVRELDHVVERAVIMTQEDVVQPSDLGLRIEGPESVRLEDLTLEEVERVLIEKALHRFDGNVSHAAEALGLSRTALYRRLEKYGHLKGPGGSEP